MEEDPTRTGSACNNLNSNRKAVVKTHAFLCQSSSLFGYMSFCILLSY